MNIHWLLRASRWARNPPSPTKVKLVLGAIALCLALVAIEHFVGWPDTLSLQPQGRGSPLH